MIVTKCDRCRKVMETPAYAQMFLPFVLPNTEIKKPVIPKYMIIRCEPNEGQDNLNLCPDCERDLDVFLDNPPSICDDDDEPEFKYQSQLRQR